MASREKIGVVVTMLAEAFGRKSTVPMLEAYTIGLGDLTDSQVDLAGTRALTSPGGFMPTPGQLRQLAITGGTSYEGRAEIAWLEFDRAVASKGGDYSVTFTDGLINATVRLCGGWIQCCEKSGDDYAVWLQKQFKETYTRLCSSGASEDLRRGFAGRLEIANGNYGNELKKFAAYTGEQVTIATSQPVIAGPTERLQIANRPDGMPLLQLKKAE